MSTGRWTISASGHESRCMPGRGRVDADRRYPRRVSRTWRFVFRAMYRGLRLLDPLIRGWYRSADLGNVIELRVRSRRTGRERSVLVGLLRAGEGLYLGHPNGHSQWTRDLQAAGIGRLVWRAGPEVEFRPVRLAVGPEREAVIRATDQHPFPGNLVYRLGRRHIRDTGVYFRLEPATD